MLSSLNFALSQTSKNFRMGLQQLLIHNHVNVNVISSGNSTINNMLRIGGYPRGHLVEIFGNESSGKTSLALMTIANIQAHGGICAYIDAEHALEPSYAQKLGVNTHKLLLSRPVTAEQALTTCKSLARSNSVDLIVIDSLAALVPKKDLVYGFTKSDYKLQAKLLTQFLRQLSLFLHKTRTVVLCINQTRAKVGVVFGSPEITPGGHALKLFASIIIRLGSCLPIYQGKQLVKYKLSLDIRKNIFAPPFQKENIELVLN